jgi:hypothetical protein
MGIFDKIKHALGFGNDEDKGADVSASAFGDAAAAASDNVAEVVSDAVSNLSDSSDPAVEVTTVDIVAVLDGKAAASSEDLDWKKSIVDLMKLVGIDASYEHRKELAQEVGIEGYHGTEDQNIELHKKVLAKLAANGGNVPAELLA